jgi:hypothetical protein
MQTARQAPGSTIAGAEDAIAIQETVVAAMSVTEAPLRFPEEIVLLEASLLREYGVVSDC